MKKLTTLAATLLISSSVFAGTQVVHSDKNFSTDAFTNKAAAYEAGFNYVNQLKQLPENKLRHELVLISTTPTKDLKIKDTRVSIEEFAQTRGQVEYRAIVNVDYNYKALRSDN
ncbi:MULTISPECIES: DUF3316 domain-containing protein [Psychromonas]|uniref:DUF3316 domain-containing protein n=1 Tax=Psychromonas TaxID=67572 RepID=UPI000408EA29|nr:MULTISPECIES: DUF3316 domain-containing protein [Psychromonas]MBB1274942.1 DUF3316 domain-containing protein [Psychromonas sp. SR45-3]